MTFERVTPMGHKGAFRERLAKTATSKYGMVSTASNIATEAGVIILERGGNAIDAAVAAAFCLGVTEPQASGIGGQSMALIRLGENDTIAVDGSSRAPFGINPNEVLREPLKVGLKASTVPSTPATLGYLLDNYGSMSIDEVLEPAITAASQGFKVTSLQHSLIARESEKLLKDPLIEQNYFKNGKALNAGDILRQPELAKCLERMAVFGWQDFYLGDISEAIIKDMESRGGLISKADLSQIPTPVERPVLTGTYRDFQLDTFPPPGAGRTLLQILNILENFEPKELRPETASAAVIIALAFHSALRDREEMPVDPELYQQLNNKLMVDKRYAAKIGTRIRRFYPPNTAGETTHLSVADKDGNIVGITQSIELVFGSKRMAQGLGFFYNNYMSAYNYKDMTHPYFLLPGARPWSSVAPTLISEEGKPFLLLGSPGSERIATSLAQVIIRFLDGGEDLARAIAGPRFHSSSKRKVQIEKVRFNLQVIEELEEAGFEITKRGAYSFYLGCVQAVMLPQKGSEEFIGVSDPRRDGSALGPKS